MKTARLIGAMAAAGVAAGSLAACAPGSSSGGDASTSRPVQTNVSSKKVALSVVTTPESGAPMAAIIKAFEKKYPNITVKVQSTTFDDYNKGLALSLKSNSSPDVALLNLVGNMPQNKLIIPLDSYSKAYSWDKKVSSNVLDQWKVSPDFKSLGGTTLYGAPTSLTLVGVYYNKALAKKAGITRPPATLAEFEQGLAKAKQAGLLPLQLGNAQGHASFTIQQIGQSIDGAPAANKWALGQPGADFGSKGNREGTAKLLDWSKKGYTSPATAVNGTDLQGAVKNFTQNKGVFFIDGNWDAGAIGKAMKSNVGFFGFPGAKPTAIGGSIAYGVSSKSKNPNEAAAFVNFLLSQEAAPAQFAAGFLPINIKAVTAKTPLETDILAAYAKVNSANGVVAFNNNATPSMNDTLIAQTQQLIAGKASPADLVTAVQKDWSGSH